MKKKEDLPQVFPLCFFDIFLLLVRVGAFLINKYWGRIRFEEDNIWNK